MNINSSTSPIEKHRNLALVATRLLWVILTCALLAIFVAGIPARFDELRQVCAGEACMELRISATEEAVLTQVGLSMDWYAGFHQAVEIVIAGLIGLIALLIFWRSSDNWIGVIVAFALILFGLNFMVETDGAFVRLHPLLGQPFHFVEALAVVPFILLFFIFPDGRFVPRWTWLVAALMLLLALADPLLRAVGWALPSTQLSIPFGLAFMTVLVVGIAAQIFRYRHVSTPTQRQQTKWVVFGLSLVLIPVVGWFIFIELDPLQAGWPRLFFNTVVYAVMALTLILFPLTLVFSIMRYRLWDIDLIIRRTLTYSLLSGALLIVYFGSVLLFQSLFGSLAGERSAFAIVVSTLLIAALFNPLRRRIQAFIDRRFFRSKYDAGQTLAAFAVTARDEVEMDALTTKLLMVVEETIQPERAGLWLRPDSRPEDDNGRQA